MLRNGNKLFVALFLISMLFTVFNYFPIIEEESPTQRIELCKKNNQEPGSNDEGDGLDEDSTGEFLLTNTNTLALFYNTVNYCKLAAIPCREYDRSHIKPPPRA